jgi:hypothetical protein
MSAAVNSRGTAERTKRVAATQNALRRVAVTEASVLRLSVEETLQPGPAAP